MLAWEMPSRAALLVALLATSAVSPAEPAQSSFWEYLSQLTSNKESPEHNGKLDRDIINTKGSIQDGFGYMGNFLEKLVPLNRGLQPGLYQDSDSLRKLIRKELESLRVKLILYVDEVHHKVGKNLEDLHSQLQPFTEELLDQVSLKAQELRWHLTPSREVTSQLLEGANEVRRFMAHYSDKITLHTEQVKAIFHPYTERLVTEIHRNMEELCRNVMPHSRGGPEQLQQYLQELSAKLTQNAQELHQQIQRNLERLKDQLKEGLVEWLGPDPGHHQPPPAAVEELAREVQRRVEQFRRDAHLQVRGFTRALDREAEDMWLKLSCCPGEPQPGPPALQDLPARLDALWRDLASSLGERGGERR